jgi:excisionase family DNA binding protein
MISPEIQFLSPVQVAKLLGVDHSKILTWIRRGELRAVDLSTAQLHRPRYKIASTDLDRFLESRATKPPPSKPPTRKLRKDKAGDEFY